MGSLSQPYQFFYVIVIFLVVNEVFNVHVHAVAPVVAWVGWDVDALGVGIRQAKLLVDGKPVLQR